MAVFYASRQQRTMGRLLTARQVRRWIRGGGAYLEQGHSPLLHWAQKRMEGAIKHNTTAVNSLSVMRSLNRQSLLRDPDELKLDSSMWSNAEPRILKRYIIYSCFLPAETSVITLSAQQLLLNLSLLTLLLALFLYLESTWWNELDDGGVSSALDIFIGYIMAVLFCFLVYSITSFTRTVDVRNELGIIDGYLQECVTEHPDVVEKWGVKPVETEEGLEFMSLEAGKALEV
jgi:hypothetical protein